MCEDGQDVLLQLRELSRTGQAVQFDVPNETVDQVRRVEVGRRHLKQRADSRRNENILVDMLRKILMNALLNMLPRAGRVVGVLKWAIRWL